MNVFSEKVSVFRTCYETTPFSTVLLKDWLQTKLYEKVICALRHLDRAPELQIQDKKALPAITPLGVFSQRSASGLLEYSGFVCIDVDGKDNTLMFGIGMSSRSSWGGNSRVCTMLVFPAVDVEFSWSLGSGLRIGIRNIWIVCSMPCRSVVSRPIFNVVMSPDCVLPVTMRIHMRIMMRSLMINIGKNYNLRRNDRILCCIGPRIETIM